VGDPAGEAAHRFHLHRLVELRLAAIEGLLRLAQCRALGGAVDRCGNDVRAGLEERDVVGLEVVHRPVHHDERAKGAAAPVDLDRGGAAGRRGRAENQSGNQ